MGKLLHNVILDNTTHEKSNMFFMTIIAHGNKEGHLKNVAGKKAWTTDQVVADVCDVDTLRGKPKIFFFQSCMGGELL